MKKDYSKIKAASKSMLEFLERRENPPPFDLNLVLKGLEKIDPEGEKALTSAREMFNARIHDV